MDCSIFMDKASKPTEQQLANALGKTYHLWQEIYKLVYCKYPGGVEDWNYPGAKYGWSFRIKDKKRAILYFLPREKWFMVAFVFGAKAFEKIMSSNIAEEIKNELKNAKVYAEGRGIRIAVKNKKQLKDIEQLIDIKLAN